MPICAFQAQPLTSNKRMISFLKIIKFYHDAVDRSHFEALHNLVSVLNMVSAEKNGYSSCSRFSHNASDMSQHALGNADVDDEIRGLK